MWWVVSRGLVVAALLTGRNAAGDEPPERVVQYAKDALTVRVTRVPVDEILGQLGQQSGAEIRGEVRDRHEITAEFEDVPLPEALHRLLGEQNFALIYGDGGRLKTVRLLGGPLAPPPPPSAAPPSSVPSPPASLPALVGLFEAHAPVPVQGRLSQALGTELATFSQLGDVALHNDDVLVRTEAVRVGLQAIEAEPEFRSAVISGVTGMGNGDRRVHVERRGDSWGDATEVWTSERLNPYFNDRVIHKGHVYGFDNRRFKCLVAKGRYSSSFSPWSYPPLPALKPNSS